MRTSITVLISAFVLFGCAMGNQYNYDSATVALPVSGSLAIAVQANDDREYVLSGKKTPDFVGLQRGGFGNPFDVTTASGDSLANEFEGAIVRSLHNSGYSAKTIKLNSIDAGSIASALGTNTDRLILLEIVEWKTDVYANITLHYDLNLSVYDQRGELLAQSNLNGKEAIGGGGFESSNSESTIAAFEQKLGYLFNDVDIRQAL